MDTDCDCGYLLCGIVYVVAQQQIRLEANQPQAQWLKTQPQR